MRARFLLAPAINVCVGAWAQVMVVDRTSALLAFTTDRPLTCLLGLPDSSVAVGAAKGYLQLYTRTVKDSVERYGEGRRQAEAQGGGGCWHEGGGWEEAVGQERRWPQPVRCAAGAVCDSAATSCFATHQMDRQVLGWVCMCAYTEQNACMHLVLSCSECRVQCRRTNQCKHECKRAVDLCMVIPAPAV